MAVIYIEAWQAVFYHFHSGLIFAGKAGDYPNLTPLKSKALKY
jgi:hypothetical protein